MSSNSPIRIVPDYMADQRSKYHNRHALYLSVLFRKYITDMPVH
ncbi:hypothetical protein QT327_00450 [Olivibacter sp. 47]|nr:MULTISPECIES: hypothetical protein [unclassified Olivibacter]MDM8172828.1 hypothetical protein [Olivibacter sp. 47]